MNAVMAFCIYATLIYLPFDFFFKPLAEDKEAWFGLLLTGYWAKATEPLHWLIYGAGWYGFWRMRSWMWPWAAIYVAQVAFSMLVWPMLYAGGFLGFLFGLFAFVPFAFLSLALWNARDLFEAAAEGFDRHGMAMHAAAARRRLGMLLGGDAGDALVAAADAQMTAQGVVDPVRFTAMFAP